LHPSPPGRYVATAAIAWTWVSQFLGWLQLPVDAGGRGLDAQAAQSLAHLADVDLLGHYQQWRIDRSGLVHGGVLGVLNFCRGLCPPETGYLTQTPELAARLGLDASAWRARCTQAYAFIKNISGQLEEERSVSRDPFAPLQAVLSLRNPLDAVADAVARMDAVHPSSGGATEAVWARDRLLLKLLASNPLRAKNIKLLTYRSDNTGHLRQDPDGAWRINIPRQEFTQQSRI
jgi:hypothetical protein